MKCEICHQAPAEEALQTIQGGESVELYVCHKCADKERRKQKREKEPSSKKPPLGVTVSVEDIWIPGADNMPKAEMLNMVSDALQKFLAARGKIGGDPPHTRVLKTGRNLDQFKLSLNSFLMITFIWRD